MKRTFVIILIFVILLLCLILPRMIEEIAVSSMSGRESVVILDPGHGGIDGGAVGISGAVEKDINLSISLMAYDYFTLLGYDCAMTRDRDISTHKEEAERIKQRKRSDLEYRHYLSKRLPNPIFISIHQNKFTVSKYSGFQIFYSKNNPGSIPLADSVHNSMLEIVDPQNTRKVKKAPNDIFLMNELTCPAILAECGFLSNSGEEKKLQNPDYQNRLAFAIFNGVQKYMSD